jgi:hypothetical protein
MVVVATAVPSPVRVVPNTVKMAGLAEVTVAELETSLLVLLE